MKPILILYATREGQTRRIAEHIASTIRARGRDVQTVDLAAPPALAVTDYDTVILAASVHLGKHEPEMERFVREHAGALAQLPTVFLSTSMTEAAAENISSTQPLRERARADAERVIELFFTRTGFRATTHKAVAGALRYTQYNWLVRLIMKQISKSEGGSTDTSCDHEYTDWLDLDRFIETLLNGQRTEVGPAAVARVT